jgi:excisionase family DNA binding protein
VAETTFQPMKRIPTKDAAAYLHVSTKTLYEWIKQGRLSRYQIGRRVSFSQEQLDSFIESCRKVA